MPAFRLSILVPALLTAPTALAQGSTPYDTYRDALGGPHYSGNLTPLPDDRTMLGPLAATGDPFLTRTRPGRGWRELDDPHASFWEYQTDRFRQRREDSEEADLRQLQRDTRQRPWKGR